MGSEKSLPLSEDIGKELELVYDSGSQPMQESLRKTLKKIVMQIFFISMPIEEYQKLFATL